MKPVSNSDYYRCRRCYGGSSLDLASLTDFYLPLIGSNAFAVYLALTREEEGVRNHEGLLSFLNLTPGEYESAVSALEAVGLVRTFYAEEENVRSFVYCLYAPLHAEEFGRDIMLAGTLKGRVGFAVYDRLYSRHQGEKEESDMQEVSVSFPEFFQPSFDAQYYLSVGKESDSEGKAKPRTHFDRFAFLAALEELGFRKNGLSDDELMTITQIATLYSLDEKTIAGLAYSCMRFNQPIGKKLDVDALKVKAGEAMPFTYIREEKGESSNVDSDTILAQKIRLMDEVTPARFLSLLQGNHAPAKSDLRLAEHLLMDIGLPAPCVNALLEYALEKNDNVLSPNYCEKVAAGMVREGCKTARDAMDYLLRRNHKNKKKQQPVETKPAEYEPSKARQQPVEDNADELDALVDELFK